MFCTSLEKGPFGKRFRMHICLFCFFLVVILLCLFGSFWNYVCIRLFVFDSYFLAFEGSFVGDTGELWRVTHLIEKERLINGFTPPQTNMTIEHPPFEDVFPTEIGIFEHHVRFEGSTLCLIEYGRSNPAVQVIYLYIRGLLFYWSRRCESLAQVPLFCRPR